MNAANSASAPAEKISPFPAETPVGMCYVPFQQWETPYAENVGFERGTIFPSLDLPFTGREVTANDRK